MKQQKIQSKRTWKTARYFQRQIRKNKAAFIVYSVLRIMVLLILVRSVLLKNYEHAMLCLLSLFLFLLPAFASDIFHWEIPPLFQIVIFVQIFAGEILGEIGRYYTCVPGWDNILHTISGFLSAAVGFSSVELLNRNSKEIKFSPFYLAMVAFCFSMTIGVLWEFFEYAADHLLAMDMQKDFVVRSFSSVRLDPTGNGYLEKLPDVTQTIITTASGKEYVIDGYLDIGIKDTMKDLFVNMIGAIVFSTLGYFYENGQNKRMTDLIIHRRGTGMSEHDGEPMASHGEVFFS